MGTLATTRFVYDGGADLIENGSLENDSVMAGSVNYNYNNATGDNFEVEETEPETTTTTTTRTVSMPKMDTKKKFDIVPLITGGGIAYLAHAKFASKPYSWAYVLGGFTIGYVGGAYLSKAINK